MLIPERLLEFTLAAVTRKEPKDFGNPCPQFIANALFVIRIFGVHTKKSCPVSVTDQLAKKVVKQTILNDLTAQCDSEFLVW